DGTIVTDLTNPQNSVTKITGNLRGFLVSLMEKSGPAEFIGITFKSLTFTSQTGQKSDVKVNIKDVEFLGVLKFIEELSKFMDFGGDGGPKIQVKGDGISADLAVKLPPIGVGIFSLRNVSINAGFNLPFDNSPAR